MVPLPADAGRIVHCPVAGTCAAALRNLLGRLGGHTTTLSIEARAEAIRERTGLALLEPARLAAQGVDPARSWTELDRPDGTWLAVFVKDRAAFARTMDAWATARGLRHRQPTPTGALYGRTAGTRTATGWAASKDRAVVLVRPGASTPEPAAVLKVIEQAAPANAPVAGTFVVVGRRWQGAREAWFGVTPRADGVDVAGRLLGVESGVFSEGYEQGWVQAALAPGPGAVRARAVLGLRGAARLADDVSARLPFTAAARATWREAFAHLAAGPIELIVPRVDVNAIELETGRVDPLKLGPPWLRFPARPGAAELFALSRRTLTGALPVGTEALRTAAGRTPATMVRRGEELWIGLGLRETKAPVVPEASPVGAATCPPGTEVAAIRLDLKRIGDTLEDVSVFSAWRGGRALGALAAGAEFGTLLQASQPAEVLACREGKAIAIVGRWRVAAP